MFKNTENAELKSKIVCNCLSVNDIAKEMGVSGMTVYRWLAGKYCGKRLDKLTATIDRMIAEQGEG